MNFPYTVLVKKDIHLDASQWCNEQWGERWTAIDNRNGSWCAFWNGIRRGEGDIGNDYKFHFLTEEQYVWFTLRWL